MVQHIDGGSKLFPESMFNGQYHDMKIPEIVNDHATYTYYILKTDIPPSICMIWPVIQLALVEAKIPPYVRCRW